MNISFINNVKGNMILQIDPNMTIKQVINKYCTKIQEDPNKFGKSIFLSHDQTQINLNSNEKVNKIFRGVDEAVVIYSEYSTGVQKNEEGRKRIRKRQHQSMNVKEEGDTIKVKDTLEDMALLGCYESIAIEKELKNSPDKFVSIDYCLKSDDEQFFILGIIAKYLEKIGIKSVIEKAEVTEDVEEQKDANTLLQFICNGYILKQKYILSFMLQETKINQLRIKDDMAMKFNELIKQAISVAYNIQKDQIIVKEFEKYSNIYTVLLVFKNNINLKLTKDELLIIFKKSKFDIKYFSDIEYIPILETIRLNKSMLDSQGNNKNDLFWGYNETRGGEIYYPPVGWHRYGLRVFNKYDNQNNDWLSYDNRKGEWCISYSGLSGFTNKNQSLENDNDIKNPGQKIGNGVFTWFKPELINNYTESIDVNGINYKMALMLRVNPKKIRIPQSDQNVWVVNGNPDEIRPYGILLKKV